MPVIGKPLRRDAERNRQRILAGARELFARDGLEVSLDDVARHAGVGVGTVYRRFANKEQLIEALFEDRMAEIGELAEQALAQRDAWRGLAGLLEALCERYAADRGLHQLFFSSAHSQAAVSEARERLRPLVEQLVMRAKAQGALRADFEPTDLGLLQFMVGSAGAYAGDVAPDAWRRYLTIVLDGLRAQRRRATPLPAPALDFDQLETAMRNAKLP